MNPYAQNKPTAEMLALQEQLLAQLPGPNSTEPLTASAILQSAMNMLMLAERQLHLQKQPENKANGFYQRQLGTPLGALDLSIPRDRKGEFRPQILPKPHQRDCAERYELLQSLIINDYTPNQISQVFQSLHLHYQPEETEQLKQEFMAQLHIWRHREIPANMLGLFIDAYHAKANLDGKVRDICIFVVIGIDFNYQKDLFGLYVYQGNENKGFWLQTLNQLIERGLKKTLFIVSDDFSGLRDAIAVLFPHALHQLCFVHMQRNVYKHMAKNEAFQFNQDLAQLRLSSKNPQDIQQDFLTLCEQKQAAYPSFMHYLKQNASHYFAFTQLPQSARKYFYTTNTVESFNSIIEKLRVQKGGFFQSESSLLLSIFMRYQKLQEQRWIKPISQLKGEDYEIRQLFARIYGHAPLQQNIFEKLQTQDS